MSPCLTLKFLVLKIIYLTSRRYVWSRSNLWRHNKSHLRSRRDGVLSWRRAYIEQDVCIRSYLTHVALPWEQWKRTGDLLLYSSLFFPLKKFWKGKGYLEEENGNFENFYSHSIKIKKYFNSIYLNSYNSKIQSPAQLFFHYNIHFSYSEHKQYKTCFEI